MARARSEVTDTRQLFHLSLENVPVLRLWGQVQSQWVHGMAGPTGFNWASLRVHPAVLCIPRGRRERMLEGLADMEGAWLAEKGRIAAAERAQAG